MDDSNIFDIVEAVYAASTAPEGWQDVSDQLGHLLPGSSVIFLHDYRSAKIHPLSMRGVNQLAIDEYHSRFAGRNPVVPRALTRPDGTSNAIEALMDRRAFDESLYYNEWFRPNGFHHSTGMRLRVNNTFSLFLTFFRSQRDGEYSIEAQRLLERIVPYLRQSIEISMRLEHMKATASEFQYALSNAGTAVFLIDRRGTIMEANPAALDLLKKEPAFQVTNGRLIATSEERLLLSQHVQRMFKEHRQERFSVSSKNSDTRYLATITRSFSDSIWLAEPTALLQIDAPRPLPESKILERAYNLTPAESRLLLALTTGESVNEFCTRTGVSRNTVKTQLSQLFAKTGTSKQKDLVRTVLRI